MKKRRTFTPEDRLNILQEARKEGRMETIRKYNLSPSLFNRWRAMYESGGIDGLKNQHNELILLFENWKKKTFASSGSLPTRHWSWSLRLSF